ncbi:MULTISPECIES: glutathione S-transferase family protein [unclassified Photobacterium]|uniref:glutathione S-transferase family protein n=1 Tax=unclassified Photobacterium TaxID=2628852 RepID=UPI000D168C54|nr:MULTISPECIES: glutathione S-transferase family protein [unclassified Photobacterium]PSV26129.1 glutathione S-transferase [Photobacterium sp. GB-56]PSV37687.1 glutathione S-transferase [Photobacterium sp. GB-210]PSV51520.1 glutathione S-transferase [Photobacterium sp. GB-1]PSV57483.1 glutathione S-transferase [Photobacterium sp. GB-3]PSW74075.1 glutathione S-transferase [Photobacterium sp. GB-50]
MIILHHLNQSRSKRIIWLLEELGVEYKIQPYCRDKVTFLAPPELKSVHPLGKSPVLEDNGMIITESGAITEYLIETYGNGKFMPERGTQAYIDYIQWLHFAESSAILPLLLKMFVTKDGAKMNFLGDYADMETQKVMQYFDQRLVDKTYLVEERLTGADFMMSFITEILGNYGVLAAFPNIQRYAEQLQKHQGYQTAQALELQYNGE